MIPRQIIVSIERLTPCTAVALASSQQGKKPTDLLSVVQVGHLLLQAFSALWGSDLREKGNQHEAPCRKRTGRSGSTGVSQMFRIARTLRMSTAPAVSGPFSAIPMTKRTTPCSRTRSL